MHDGSLLIDIAIILLAAFPLLFLGRRFRIPEVLSYIVAGIVIGPHALGLIRDPESIDAIAELGVALILFFIGLHVPLGRLKALGRTAFVGGPVQMGLTTLVGMGAALAFGTPVKLAIFYGILISLASTAVVLPILTMRDEVAAPFARRFLGVSLFQDLAVIPLMLLVPAFAASRAGAPGMPAVLMRVVFAVGAVIVLILVARVVVPRMFTAMARVGREAFTASAVVLMISTIAIASRIGISPALGAFAAGLVVGDTEFIHEIEGILRPFRDFLSALFFTSIGMLLNPAFVISQPLLVVSIVVVVLLIKVSAAYPAFRISDAMSRTSVRAAFAIAPIGEFSFLLARAGKEAGVINDSVEQAFVAVAVTTLAATPLLVSAGKWLSERIHETSAEEDAPHGELPLHRHIIIVGYGLNGQNVARVLVSTGIRHVVLDEDPQRLAAARVAGSRALLADAADPHALELAGLEKALAVIVAISDPDGTRRIVSFCRKINHNVHIIVRTRYVAEVERLRTLGADEIIPEEFETSLEIVTRTLRIMAVPGNIIANQLRLLRDEGYRMLRDPAVRATDGRRLSALFAAGTSQTFLVLPDSYVEGKTISDLHMAEDGVAVAALLREGRALSPLPVGEPLLAGDTMLLVGAHEDLTRVVARIEHEGPGG
ncbi:MAG: cation:proton antiporter [Acidobacteriota bacterium]